MEHTTNGSGTERSGTTDRILVCDNCGREFIRNGSHARNANSCNRACYRAAMRSGKFLPLTRANEPLGIPHKNVFIRVTQILDVYEDYRPDVGRIYPAEKYENQKIPGYVVVVNGHRVCVRYGECEEVEHE